MDLNGQVNPSGVVMNTGIRECDIIFKPNFNTADTVLGFMLPDDYFDDYWPWPDGPKTKTGCFHGWGTKWWDKLGNTIHNWFSGGSHSGNNNGQGDTENDDFGNNIVYTIFPTGSTLPTGGISVGGGSNNIGIIPVQYHFTHIYDDPLLVIKDYMLDMEYSANAYYKFTFLNLSCRQFLANEQYFIDMFYEFLQENNHSVPARNFVSDFIQQMVNHNLMWVDINDLHLLFTRPDFYQTYKSYLSQNPNASTDDKKVSLRMFIDSPEHPLIDLPSRLNCFNTTNNQSSNTIQHWVVIYVDQPVNNNSMCIDYAGGPFAKVNIGAGHTWLGVEQDFAGDLKQLSVGLYPKSSANPAFPHDEGEFSHDQNRGYDEAYRWNITAEQFNTLINNLKNYSIPPDYDLNDNNCTTFAYNELEKIGVNLPPVNKCTSDWKIGSGFCPGMLGEALKEYATQLGGELKLAGSSPSSTCQ